jgi:hypothetical protein
MITMLCGTKRAGEQGHLGHEARSQNLESRIWKLESWN